MSDDGGTDASQIQCKVSESQDSNLNEIEPTGPNDAPLCTGAHSDVGTGNIGGGTQSPDSGEARPSPQHTETEAESRDQGVAPASNGQLSFFHDYTVVDGVVQIKVDIEGGNESGIHSFKLSAGGGNIGVGYNNGMVQIFELPGGREVGSIEPGNCQLSCFEFERQSDEVILHVDTAGVFTRWERQRDGLWRVVQRQHCPIVESNVQNRFELTHDGTRLVHTCYATPREIDSNTPQRSCKCSWYDVHESLVRVDGIEGPARPHSSDFQSVRFSPDGRGILITDSETTFAKGDFERDDAWACFQGGDGKWVGDTRIITSQEDNRVLRLCNLPFYLNLIDNIPGQIVLIFGDRILLKNQGPRLEFTIADGISGSALYRFECQEDDRWPDRSHPDYVVACMSDHGRWLAICVGGNLGLWDAKRFVLIWDTVIEDAHVCTQGKRELFFDSWGQKLFLASRTEEKMTLLMYVFDDFRVYPSIIPIDDRYTVQKWHTSSSCTRIGLGLSLSRTTACSHLLIWTSESVSTTVLKCKPGVFLKEFCFAPAGDKMATVTSDGFLQVWDVARPHTGMLGFEGAAINTGGGDVQILGDRWPHTRMVGFQGAAINTSDEGLEVWHNSGPHMAVHEVLGGANWANLETNDRAVPKGLCFSENGEGAEEAIVVLTEGAVLLWLAPENMTVVDCAVLQFQGEFGCRFSADGWQCIIVYIQAGKMEVWDLVTRTKCEMLNFNVPDGLHETLEALNFEQQVSFNGNIVLGVDQEKKPWILAPDSAVEEVDFKLWNECVASDFGVTNIVGPIAAVSEDGRHVAFCVSQPGSLSCIRVQYCTSNRTGKVLTFQSEGDTNGILLLSGNGECVVLATRRGVRVWGPLCDARCVPKYGTFVLSNPLNDEQAARLLLDAHGRTLLNWMNATGWTFIAETIRDNNVEVLAQILDWAQETEQPILMDTGIDLDGTVCRNVLHLAVILDATGCLRLLLDRILSGSIPGNAGEIVGECVYDLLAKYPEVFTEVIFNPVLMQLNGGIRVPSTVFKGKKFLLCTDDALHPGSLEGFWSNSLDDACGGTDIRARIQRMVVAESFVIPIKGLTQVGPQSLLSQVLASDLEPKVLTAQPLHCAIQWKWDTFGQRAAIATSSAHLVWCIIFTAYAVLLGYGCKADDGLVLDLRVACGVALVLSMLISLVAAAGGLYSRIKRFRGGRMYFAFSRIALDFVVWTQLAAVSLVIPYFHFFGNPCNPSGVLSWLVPIASSLMWCNFFLLARTFQFTGPLMVVIGAILKDISLFLVIGSGVVLGFGVGFFVLYRGDEDNAEAFGSINRSLLTVFAMMLADFDLNVLYTSPVPTLAVLMFVAYVLAITIILLNLLIAIMGDSFDRIKSVEEEVILIERARRMDMSEGFPSIGYSGKRVKKHEIVLRRKNTEQFLHVLVPKDNSDGNADWHGRVIDLERRFRRVVSQYKADQEELVRKGISSIGKTVEQENSSREASTNRRIDALEKKIEEMREWICNQ